MAKPDDNGIDLTEENPQRADQLRAILLASQRWSDLVDKLPWQAISKAGPVNFDDCTAEEAIEIARWAVGESDAKAVPARLALYVDKVSKG